MAKILLVEDDIKLAESIKQWLLLQRDVVDVAPDGITACAYLASFPYDMVILDWGLPGKSGIEVCKEFRSRGGKSPLLLLTARSEIEDKELGFEAGADDYLTKPVNLRELSARIKALLRRPGDIIGDVIKVGDLILQPGKYSVSRNDEEISLTAREFSLLEFLMRHPDQFFTPDVLLERVWSSDIDTTSLSVRVCVKRLRDKIDQPDRSYIENIKGLGYRLLSRV